LSFFVPFHESVIPCRWNRKEYFSEVLVILLFLSFSLFSQYGETNRKCKVIIKTNILHFCKLFPVSHIYIPWIRQIRSQRASPLPCMRLFTHWKMFHAKSICLVACGISVNDNFLLSIINVYRNVTTLHVSVVLTTIKQFVDNKIYHFSLLNSLRNGSVAAGLIMWNTKQYIKMHILTNKYGCDVEMC
jgi:hypothetical protein